MRARISVYYIFFCDLRAPKTDFEKSQALGKKYYGHPAVIYLQRRGLHGPGNSKIFLQDQGFIWRRF